MRRSLPLLALVALLGAVRPAPHYALTPFELRAPVGATVPSMTLHTLDGGAIETALLRGKPAYVFLFASWCEPCRKSLPNVRADVARYGDRVRFLAVDVYEDRDRAEAFAAREKLPFPVALYTLDELDAAVPLAVRESAGKHFDIPADVLIDAEGIVRASWYGIYDTSDGGARDDVPDALAKLGIH